MLLVVDHEQRLIYTSPSSTEVYGASPSLDRPVAEVLGPAWLSTGDPDEAIAELVDSGRWTGPALHQTGSDPIPVLVEARLRVQPAAASDGLYLVVRVAEEAAVWERSLAGLELDQREERARCRMGVERLERLQAISARLVSVASITDVVDVVCGEAVAGVSAHAGALFLVEGDRLAVFGTCGYPRELVRRWGSTPLDDSTPAAEAAAAGRPVWIESTHERDTRFPALAAAGSSAQSWCALPLMVDGPVFGVLGFSFPQPQVFDRPTRNFLLTVAQQCAHALDRIRRSDGDRPPGAGRAAIVVETDARRGVSAAVRRLFDNLADTGVAVARHGDAELIAGELIVNAIRHTPDPYRVSVDVDGQRVRIEVDDLSGQLPSRRTPALDEPGGRGLLLVEGLADRWGVELRPWGKRVWAELDAERTAP